MRQAGKKIGNCIYIHRQYRGEIVPPDVWHHALTVLDGEPDGYTGIRYNRKTRELTFQWSPDFDTNPEPTLGRSLSVRPDGTVKKTYPQKDPMIWHHKWLWVKDDYSGFDVEESKARSKQWESHVTKNEKRRIGRESFWDSIRKRWE